MILKLSSKISSQIKNTPGLWKTAHCRFSHVQLYNPMDYSLPGSSVHGDSPVKNTEVGGHALLQGIFLTQGSKPYLLSPALAGGFLTTSATWEAPRNSVHAC